VPHIGWNQISIKTKDCRILEGVMEKSFVYFCHSYFVNPKDKSVVAASCAYGVNFASVVNIRNIYGVQFHPEKSQDVGLKIIDNFTNLC